MSKLRDARKALGLTQSDLALKAGVARTSVVRWEREGVIKKSNIEQLSKVLGVAPEDLSEFETNAKSKHSEVKA